MKPIQMMAIGTVRPTRGHVTDDNWDGDSASIELDPREFTDEALAGLTDFSHAEVFFYMNQVDP